MQVLDFDEMSNRLAEFADISSASEIHGLISGLASVGLAADFDQIKKLLCHHLEMDDCSEPVSDAMKDMQKKIIEELEDAEFGFKLLLPDDDEELYSRVDAMSQWCQGFLVGFGTGVKTAQQSFSKEAQEVLRDLVEISKVGHEDDDPSVVQVISEEDEVAYTELQEYLRAAAMTLYTEFGVEELPEKKGSDAPLQGSEDSPSDVYH